VRLYRQSELRTLPCPKFLVDGYLLERSLAQLSGSSGAGKTFVFTDWACRLAAAGRKALVIVGEGFYRYQSRLDAWQVHHGTEVPNDNLIVVDEVPALPDAAQMAELIALVGRIRGTIDLIVVDTFAKGMSGYNEQDAADVTVALANLGALRRTAGGATGLLVTHFGWEGTRQRGSSALYGECDTVLYLKKVSRRRISETTDGEETDSLGYLCAEDPPKSKRVRLHLEKQRDAPDDIPAVTLERTDVKLGYDGPDGTPAVSCVYLPVAPEPKKTRAAANGNGSADIIDLTDFRVNS